MTRKNSLLLLFAASLLLLGAAGSSSRNAMIDALGSPNPNPVLGDEARTFDQLVGTWDADFTFHRPDGTILHKKGELHFGWVMDGTAMQDLWIGYPAEAGKERSIGTTIRFLDPQTKQWRIVFVIRGPITSSPRRADGKGTASSCAARTQTVSPFDGPSWRSLRDRSTGRAKSRTTTATAGSSKKIIT